MKLFNLQDFEIIIKRLRPIKSGLATPWSYGNFLEWHAQLETQEKPMDLQFKRIRLQENANASLAILEISYINGDKLNYWVDGDDLIIIEEILKKHGAKSWNVYTTIGTAKLDWSDLKAHYDKKVIADYQSIHESMLTQLKNNVNKLADNHKDNLEITKINLIDAGCGQSPDFLQSGYAIVKDAFPNATIHALGFDFEKSNIDVCNHARIPNLTFIQADLNHIQTISRDTHLAKSSPNTHTIMLSSGSMTRYVLSDAFESMRIFKECWRAQIQQLILSGERELLFNERMLERMGLTLSAYTPDKHDLSPVVTLERLSDLELIEKQKAKLRRHPDVLDLSLCPIPDKILKVISQDPTLALHITKIDLSFSDIIDLPSTIASLTAYQHLKEITFNYNQNPIIMAELRAKLGSHIQIKGNLTSNELLLLGSEKYYKRTKLMPQTQAAENQQAMNILTTFINKGFNQLALHQRKYLLECYRLLSQCPVKLLKEITTIEDLKYFLHYMHLAHHPNSKSVFFNLANVRVPKQKQPKIILMLIKANQDQALKNFLQQNNLKLFDLCHAHKDLLFAAVDFNSLKILQLFKDENVNLKISKPNTLMVHAIKNNKSQMVEALGRLCPELINFSLDGIKPLCQALETAKSTASLPTLKAYFALKPDLTKKDFFNFPYIAHDAYIKSYFTLHQAGVDLGDVIINAKKETLLEYLISKAFNCNSANFSWSHIQFNPNTWIQILKLLEESTSPSTSQLTITFADDVKKSISMNEFIHEVETMLKNQLYTSTTYSNELKNSFAYRLNHIAEKYHCPVSDLRL